MPCSNCGYKMRFVGGKWACDNCGTSETGAVAAGSPEDLLDAKVSCSPYDDETSWDWVTMRGRLLHGDDFTLSHAALTEEQHEHLAKLDSRIVEVLHNYRKDEGELETDKELRVRGVLGRLGTRGRH